jgi:nucleoside-diphosphate-sugar epimerase
LNLLDRKVELQARATSKSLKFIQLQALPPRGEGQNRWPAAHLSDVALLYKLAVERGEPGARYNAVAEEGITTRAIAEALGRRLKLPVVSLTGDQAAAHFGWMTIFAGVDMPASSAITRKKLGWNPVGPGLIADLENLES